MPRLAQEPLDCFVLFSSIAGLFGNAGQSDYAYGNAYLDAFAHRREELRRAGRRSGRTLSLNWPLWSEGGLQGNLRNGRTEALGLVPLDRQTGLQIFETALPAVRYRSGVASGAAKRSAPYCWSVLRKRRRNKAFTLPLRQTPKSVRQTRNRSDELSDSAVRSLDENGTRQIRPAESLEKYGFDSIMAVEFSQQLERDFGELSKTLLFEYPTLEALAGYFLENHSERLATLGRTHLRKSSPRRG